MVEFKEGDVVRCKRDVEGEFTKEKLYKVSEVVEKDDYPPKTRLRFEKDDSDNKNGWFSEYFELVRRKGEFKVGDIVSWRDIPYWQNATVRKVEGTKVYADSEGKNTASGEGLFPQNEEFYELILVKPVDDYKTAFKIDSYGRLVFEACYFAVFPDEQAFEEEQNNHELTVNEARAIAEEVEIGYFMVIDVYDELIKRGFKITKD